MKKGNILMVVLLIIILLILVIVGFLYWRGNFKAKPTVTYLHEGCKPTYKVETGPELTASQNYSELCYGKNKDNCYKADAYNKLKNDFSRPDGIPDCEWGLLDW